MERGIRRATDKRLKLSDLHRESPLVGTPPRWKRSIRPGNTQPNNGHFRIRITDSLTICSNPSCGNFRVVQN
jgi:hypothetical protein